MAPAMLQLQVRRERDAMRANLPETRATITSKASPPGDVDAITSERGEHNTILLMGELMSERE